jgi:hypothetical protein
VGLLDKIKSFLKPLPQQQVMDRKEDIDPVLDQRNTLEDPGTTHPNPTVQDTERPPPGA